MAEPRHLLQTFFLIIGLLWGNFSHAASEFREELLVTRQLLPIEYFPQFDDFLEVEISTFHVGDYITEVAIPVFVRNFAGGDAVTTRQALAAQGRTQYLSYVLERLEFGIRFSDTRGWPEGFAELRRQVARDYLNRSIYYTVRKRTPLTNEPGEIVGTYRDVFAPYSTRYLQRFSHVHIEQGSHGDIYKSFFFCPWRELRYSVGQGPALDLPMERLLGITLPRPIIYASYNSDLDTSRPLREYMDDISFTGYSRYFRVEGEGLLMEPGNFAIDHAHNKPAFGQILVQLLNAARYPMERARLDPSEIRYYTYGNRTSLRQYGRMGFKTVPALETGYPLKDLPEANEYLWYPMNATYRDLRGYLDEVSNRRQGWTSDDANDLRRLFDATSQAYSQSPRHHGTQSGKDPNCARTFEALGSRPTDPSS